MFCWVSSRRIRSLGGVFAYSLSVSSQSLSVFVVLRAKRLFAMDIGRAYILATSYGDGVSDALVLERGHESCTLDIMMYIGYPQIRIDEILRTSWAGCAELEVSRR